MGWTNPLNSVCNGVRTFGHAVGHLCTDFRGTMKQICTISNVTDVLIDVGIGIGTTVLVAAGGWAILPAVMAGAGLLKAGLKAGVQIAQNIAKHGTLKNCTEGITTKSLATDFLTGAVVSGISPLASFAGGKVAAKLGGELAQPIIGKLSTRWMSAEFLSSSFKQRAMLWGGRRFTEGFVFGSVDNGFRAGLAGKDPIEYGVCGGIFGGLFNMAFRSGDLRGTKAPIPRGLSAIMADVKTVRKALQKAPNEAGRAPLREHLHHLGREKSSALALHRKAIGEKITEISARTGRGAPSLSPQTRSLMRQPNLPYFPSPMSSYLSDGLFRTLYQEAVNGFRMKELHIEMQKGINNTIGNGGIPTPNPGNNTQAFLFSRPGLIQSPARGLV